MLLLLSGIIFLLVVAVVVLGFLLKFNNRQDNLKAFLMEQEYSRLEQLKTSLARDFQSLNDSLFLHLSNFQEHNNSSQQNFIQHLSRFQSAINSDLALSTGNIQEQLRKELERLNAKVEYQLQVLDNKVEETLRQNLLNSQKTFGEVLARLARIDEAQKQLDSLSLGIRYLQDTLTDKKARGTFGEVQLKQLLESIFGSSQKLYSVQFTLTNGYVTDAIVFAPYPLGHIAIDSKFPLENYRKMLDSSLSEEERKSAKKLFEQNVRRHVDDIANKYIVAEETSQHAIMFIPAEAIFAQIHAHHEMAIVNYARAKKIWISSPTTLMAMLSTVQSLNLDIKRAKFSKIIQEELGKLHEEFLRYKKRWDELSKDIEKVSQDVREIHTTSKKIDSKFQSIQQVDLLQE